MALIDDTGISGYMTYEEELEAERMEMYGPVEDIWVWMPSVSLLLGTVLEIFIGRYLNFFNLLYFLFWVFDLKELKEKGYVLGAWKWWGVIMFPVYLFIRASKTNQKYGYAKVWCVIFCLSIIVTIVM
ncbi:MAG: hypothetical protein FWB85_11800 [Chitinispirillia bacterium]|nr:hypothetical protein [Chitinispirillia bacterium]